MAKAMREAEVRTYTVVGERSAMGRSTIDVRCPFCERVVTCYVWSLAGSGKRCECGALFGGRGVATFNPRAVLRVPKWLRAEPEMLAWAYRHGITLAIWYRERRVLPSFQAYVQADSRLLRFADQVTRVWLARHPEEER